MTLRQKTDAGLLASRWEGKVYEVLETSDVCLNRYIERRPDVMLSGLHNLTFIMLLSFYSTVQ